MDFADAKKALKDGYTKAGLTLGEERELELEFVTNRGVPIIVRENEIRGFAETDFVRQMMQITPNVCGICSPIYREQAVSVENSDISSFVGHAQFPITLGSKQDLNQPYVEIGRASDVFINCLRFTDGYLQYCLEREIRLRNVSRRNAEFAYRPLVIRIHNLAESDVTKALLKSHWIIDTSLFEVAYFRDFRIDVVEEWPRRQKRVQPFRFREGDPDASLPLRNVKINPDLVRFYQRGVSASDPVIQFLSFYQVLEYFFVKVADEQLYAKLASRLNDPGFTTTASQLDRLIQDVVKHNYTTDENEMLRLVLKKYVQDENELAQFIAGYEDHLHGKVYSQKRKLFGEEIHIVAGRDYFLPSVAKVVKTIRNALVHSSDRHERKERYIPGAMSEQLIRQEIPLIRFLAEKVIIASAV